MYDIHVIIENQVGALALLATTLGNMVLALKVVAFFYRRKSHAHFLVTQPEKARDALTTEGLG